MIKIAPAEVRPDTPHVGASDKITPGNASVSLETKGRIIRINRFQEMFAPSPWDMALPLPPAAGVQRYTRAQHLHRCPAGPRAPLPYPAVRTAPACSPRTATPRCGSRGCDNA